MGTAPQTVANQVTAALAQLRRELSELIAEVEGTTPTMSRRVPATS